MQPDDRIQIGVVGKPHGVRGGFHLDGCIDAPALVPGLALRLGGDEYEVASRGGVDSRPLLSLVGIGDRDAIAALRGAVVTARRADLTPLAEGEWFADDLVGLAVVSTAGVALGSVVRMTNLPSVDVLEVKSAEGETLMIPMISDAIASIDPDGAGVSVDAEFLNLG
ncbi:MAG: ribosome maturation factor RimM [Solirubrobacterales bacterium]